MKSIKMFGKSVPLVAIVLTCMLVIGASAALATYLSNTVGAEFEVQSPMFVAVSLGKTSWAGDRYPEGSHSIGDWTTSGTLALPDVYGGGTMTVYLMSQNLADGEVYGFEEVIVTNTAGVSHEDFASVVVSVDSIWGDLGYGAEADVIALEFYLDIDSTHMAFGSPALSLWGEGETDVTKIVVTFEEAASGTYTLSYRVIPEVPTP